MSSVLLLSFFLLLLPMINIIESKPNLSSFIVLKGEMSRPSTFLTQADWHSSMLNSVANSTFQSANTRIFYNFNSVFKGFVVRLTSQEAAQLKKMAGVSAVIDDTLSTKLQTTRTPQFLGLDENVGLWPMARFGDNVIIGLVDSGIWPESRSFKDDGLGPTIGWTGSCNFEENLCNNKLIGAKAFTSGYQHFVADGLVENDEGDYNSPRDTDGHGTHIASTAAGASVEDTNIFGFADGTARGIAVNAKITIFKACIRSSCADSDILAAMETAIIDGVHVLSLSLTGHDVPYYDNYIARGAFAAVSRGIFVVCAAGNFGPDPYSVKNTAPWITTVGASDIDRKFPVTILLGNGQRFVGSSLYDGTSYNNDIYQTVYVEDCATTNLVLHNLKGNILVCTTHIPAVVNIGITVQRALGKGVIVLNPTNFGEVLVAQPFTLPGTMVGFSEGLEIRNYITTTNNPTASFIFTNVTSVRRRERAPVVASFSSRGPNLVVPEILKPDLVTPGLNILAAFPPTVAPLFSINDKRRVSFNTMSGTSMACPHVAGAAALLIAVHRDWSPAAIRSALMTTASAVDNQFNLIYKYDDMTAGTPLDFGAGQIKPELAVDPGLVYDADVSDYINFMCSLQYTADQMRVFVDTTNPCFGNKEKSPADLNYPSISVVLGEGQNIREIVRTVTNVGKTLVPESYNVLVDNPGWDKVTVAVEPRTMRFTNAKEKQSFRVKIIGNGVYKDQQVFGYIIWMSDHHHFVKSPFFISWQ